MIKRIDHTEMGSSKSDWLQSIFHFSFANYSNPSKMNFGTLRVVNDDLVKPNNGFAMHPHSDMEIISYVVEGELTHEDSMGNKSVLSRGEVQYMSAGTGVRHSEYNHGEETLRLIQIWIFPDEKGHKPNYGEYKYSEKERKNKWLNIVSSTEGDSAIKINQDANIFVLELDKGREVDFKVESGRQAYLVQVEGASDINGTSMNTRDALEIVEEDIKIKAEEKSHFLVIEMKK